MLGLKTGASMCRCMDRIIFDMPATSTPTSKTTSSRRASVHMCACLSYVWMPPGAKPISLEPCGDELPSCRRTPFDGGQNEASKSPLGASTTGATKLPINVSRVRSEARFRPATWHRRRKADLCALQSWHGLGRLLGIADVTAVYLTG